MDVDTSEMMDVDTADFSGEEGTGHHKFHVLLAFVFVGSVWLLGKLFGVFHGKLIGEILAGFILGGHGFLFLFLFLSFSFFSFLSFSFISIFLNLISISFSSLIKRNKKEC